MPGRRRAVGLFILATLNIVAVAVLGLAVNVASELQPWPGPLDLGRRHPWWAISTLTAIAVLSTVIAIALERRPVTTTPTTHDEPQGVEVVVPFWCLSCGRTRKAKIYFGYAGGGACPKCGAFFVITIDHDGSISCMSNGWTATYRARKFFRLIFRISDISYRKTVNGKELLVLEAVFICPRCYTVEKREVHPNRTLKLSCRKCSLPYRARASTKGRLTSVGDNRKMTYEVKQYMFGTINRARFLTNEEYREPSSPS